MKLVKKLSIFALAALLALGSACNPVSSTPSGGSDQGDVAKYYGNPNCPFGRFATLTRRAAVVLTKILSL